MREEKELDLEVLTSNKNWYRDLKELLELCGRPVSGVAWTRDALIKRLIDHGNEASRARAREMIEMGRTHDEHSGVTVGVKRKMREEKEHATQQAFKHTSVFS